MSRADQQWEDLSRRLQARYPDDWEPRMASYRDGTNADLLRWRKIGGLAFTHPDRPTKRIEAKITREGLRQRIYGLYCVGVDPSLIAEWLGVDRHAVSEALMANGVRRLRPIR